MIQCCGGLSVAGSTDFHVHFYTLPRSIGLLAGILGGWLAYGSVTQELGDASFSIPYFDSSAGALIEHVAGRQHRGSVIGAGNLLVCEDSQSPIDEIATIRLHDVPPNLASPKRVPSLLVGTNGISLLG
jgi:hypothetical protein